MDSRHLHPDHPKYGDWDDMPHSASFSDTTAYLLRDFQMGRPAETFSETIERVVKLAHAAAVGRESLPPLGGPMAATVAVVDGLLGELRICKPAEAPVLALLEDDDDIAF